ncbi:hypothetical protein TSUD_347650 [Trifolium subterraneum]|nr:hypothetical protein TSUD_347650 [Trifolium subterraneum]
MEAETRRKVEDMVLDILQKSDIQETTEFTIRVAASERLGIDLSGPETKRFVRTIIETYLLSIAAGQKPPAPVTTEFPVTPKEPPQVSNEPVNVTIPEEKSQELNKVVGVKRKNDDSEKVICQLSTRRNVAVRDFKGMTLVSIREFYNKDGKQLPTSKEADALSLVADCSLFSLDISGKWVRRKGISLSSEQWSTFKNCVPAIEEAIAKLEGRIRSGINGKKNGEVASSVIDVPVEPVAIESVDIEPVAIEIVRFDGKNFQVWAEQMELFLKQLKINYVLTEPCPNATLGEKDVSTGETKAAEKRWLPLSWKDLSIKLMREEYLPFWKLMEYITKEEESRNGVKQMGEPPSDSARFHRANEGGSSGADIKPPPGFQRKYEPNSKNVSCYICGQKGHFSKNCWRWL